MDESCFCYNITWRAFYKVWTNYVIIIQISYSNTDFGVCLDPLSLWFGGRGGQARMGETFWTLQVWDLPPWLCKKTSLPLIYFSHPLGHQFLEIVQGSALFPSLLSLVGSNPHCFFPELLPYLPNWSPHFFNVSNSFSYFCPFWLFHNTEHSSLCYTSTSLFRFLRTLASRYHNQVNNSSIKPCAAGDCT